MMHILERLRQAREQQGIDLEELARRTRLRTHLLEAVEQGRWADLPRGVYARAVVRTYAQGVGMDPNRVLTEVAPLLPEPEDPLDGLARVRGFERQAAPAAAPPAPRAFAPVPEPAVRAGLLTEAAAAATDTLVLLGVGWITSVAAAWVCGVTVAELIAHGGVSILALVLLAGAAYFVLLGGIGGATLGSRLAGVRAPGAAFRGDLTTAARAGGLLALRRASIVVEALMSGANPVPATDTPGVGHSDTPWEGRAPAR